MGEAVEVIFLQAMWYAKDFSFNDAVSCFGSGQTYAWECY